MKAFRQVILSALLTLGAFTSVVFYTSCKNKCGSITCQNGGTCSDNKCSCPTGYYNNACQSAWDDPLIGTYHCSRSGCSPAVIGVNAWTSTITKNSVYSGYTINISNFDNSNTIVTGTVDSAIGGINHIVVAPAPGTFGVNATGTYENGVIKLQFTTASSTGAGYSCNMELVKQ